MTSIITENAVRDFIANQESGSTSKGIATHFGVNSKLVNTGYSLNHEGLFVPTWKGIYKTPGIKTIEFVHYLSDSDSAMPLAIASSEPATPLAIASSEPAMPPTTTEPVAPSLKFKSTESTTTKITIDLLICGIVLAMFLINTFNAFNAFTADYKEIPRLDFLNQDNDKSLSVCFRERVNIF